jgi:hypothetical protein
MSSIQPNSVTGRTLHGILVFGLVTLSVACIDPTSQRRSQTEPDPEPPSRVDTVVVQRRVVDTVTVANPETEQQLAQLQLRLLEKDAQIATLQTQLEESTREVVRSLARQQTVASRAEAASAMAEAEVALEQLRTAAGGRETSEIRQVQSLLENSTAAFNQENYGGSLYLANQAKTIAGADRGRLLRGAQGSMLPGESLFTVPLQLQTVRRSNVREGPGTEYGIAFTLESGAPLVANSYVGPWLRVNTPDGQTGWIFQSLVESGGGGGGG